MDYHFYYLIACALMLPMLIYSIYCSSKVNTTFRKYNAVVNSRNLTAAQVARDILDKNGLTNVQIDVIPGNLTDNFDPRSNIVHLSESVANNKSLSAIGVAAHECGHAIQHATGYIPIKIRSAIVPVVNLGSRLAFPLLMVGLLLDLATYAVSSNIGFYIIIAGVALYSLTTLFALITLPGEFNASRRAKKILRDGILSDDEVDVCGEVLSAAAKTYVASFALSFLQLIRIAFMFLGRRNRK